MNKMTIVLMAALIVAVLFVSGCAKDDTGSGTDDTGIDDTKPPEVPKDALSQEVSEDISDVDSAGTELDDADVENLDEEFENIDWN